MSVEMSDIQIANAAVPSPLSMGRSGEWWDGFIIVSVVLAAIAALTIVISTFGSIKSHKREAEKAEFELEHFKADTEKKSIEAEIKLEAARTESALANVEAAKANRKAAEIQRDALPRMVGVVSQIEKLRQFAGIDIYVLTVPDFESLKFDGYLRYALEQANWNVKRLSFTQAGVEPLQVSDGVWLFSWTSSDPNSPEHNADSALSALREYLGLFGVMVRSSPIVIGHGGKPHFVGIPFNNDAIDPPKGAIFMAIGVKPPNINAVIDRFDEISNLHR